jgi:folate-binding protein YgfZ
MSRLADQYRIIASGAGWIDRRGRGRLRFEGRDASSFLQALVTNDVEALHAGGGVYAAYLTPQGRMLTDLRIHHRGDHLLAEVEPGLAAGLAERFDRLIFTEDVRVSDVSNGVAQIGMLGENTAALLAHAFALEPIDPDTLTTLPVLGHIEMAGAAIARTDDVGLPAFDVFVKSDAYDAAIQRLEEMGAVPASQELVEALRIEAGRPAFGVDMTEETIPLEAGLLDRAISTTKGCYVGQEIIIRVLHRGGGRVAKRLVKLRFDLGLDAPPAAGALLFHDTREVGRVTSAAVSASHGGVIALGYVHRDQAESGVRVALGSDAGGHPAEIVGLAG